MYRSDFFRKQSQRIVQRIEEIGPQFKKEHWKTAMELKSALKKAKNPYQIREAFLMLVEREMMSFEDLQLFCPAEHPGLMFVSRDWWLALLYDRSKS